MSSMCFVAAGRHDRQRGRPFPPAVRLRRHDPDQETAVPSGVDRSRRLRVSTVDDRAHRVK